MDKELTKKKNELLKSIMSNPKLAKTFKEAMAAPIGSTKREQAKSVLSIMRKLGGIRNDGAGGPMSTTQNPVQTNQPDYSNVMIFPAAPKLKVKVVPVKSEPKGNDGQGGLSDYNFGTNFNTGSFFPTQTNQTYEAPKQVNQLSGLSSLAGSAYNKVGEIGYNIGTGVGDTFSALNPFAPKPNINFGGSLSPYGTMPNSTPTIAGKYGGVTNAITSTTPPASSAVAGPVYNGPVQTAITGALDKTKEGGTSGAQTGTGTSGGSQVVIKGSGPNGEMTEGDRIKSAAQKAVNEGTGAGLFAMGVANEKFGGSLDEYINKLDTKLKTDFNLEGLETELSNLKSQKNNLVPTLTQYIKGKDNYLKFIDGMIDQTEGALLKQDMGNPAVANSYNNYLTYLYTLKGRQSQRYGNFLNSAISDYNADLESTQSNYDNVYSNYKDAITRKATIAQNEYNTLYQTMGDLYNNLEQAPLKRANLEALQLQNTANALIIAQNGIDQNTNTNPKYLEDVKKYGDHISDKDGNLSTEALGAGGLAGFFAEINYQGGDPQAAAKAINTAMAMSLKNAGEDSVKKAIEFKSLVDDLASLEGGDQLAAMISPSLSKAAYPIVSSYVLNNLDAIKSATKSLVSGSSPWFSKNKSAGLKDPTSWVSDNKNLDDGILQSLYNTAKVNITPGSAYEKNPSTFISALFSGGDNDTISKNVASTLLSSW